MQDRVRLGDLELGELRVEADVLGADLGEFAHELLALEVAKLFVELMSRVADQHLPTRASAGLF